MLKLDINGKEYTFEFTIEASMYAECVESVTNLFLKIGEAEAEENTANVLASIANIPKTTMTMFYAGLLENHSDTVKGMADAKELVKQYLVEHKEDGEGDFYSLMNKLLGCMEDDGFFDLTGLGKMMRENAQSAKTPKTPQDHKRKATKK